MRWRRTVQLALTAALAGAGLVILLQANDFGVTRTGTTTEPVPARDLVHADSHSQNGQTGVWVEPVRRVKPVTPPGDMPDDVPVPLRKPIPSEASTREAAPSAGP